MANLIFTIILSILFFIMILFFSFYLLNWSISLRILLRKDRGIFFRRVLVGQEAPWGLTSILFGVIALFAIFFIYVFGTIAQFQGHFLLILPIIHLLPLSLILGLLGDTNKITAILYGFFLPTGDIIVPLVDQVPKLQPFIIMNVFWKDKSGFIAEYSKALRRIISLIFTPFIIARFYIFPFIFGVIGLWLYFSGIQNYHKWWIILISILMILFGLINLFVRFVRYNIKIPIDKRLKW